MAERRTNRSREHRLTIPTRLTTWLPKIHWALILLRQTIDLQWITLEPGEDRTTPFMNIFDDETQATIERLRLQMKAPQQSRSTIVNTALEIYRVAPKAGEPDRGLSAAGFNKFGGGVSDG